jgi:hypothetical protein
VPRPPRDRAEAHQGEGEDPLEPLCGRRRSASSLSRESRRTGDRTKPACGRRSPRRRPGDPDRRPPLARLVGSRSATTGRSCVRDELRMTLIWPGLLQLHVESFRNTLNA